MNDSTLQNILKPFYNSLKNLAFVLKTEGIPVYRLSTEIDPENTRLVWHPLQLEKKTSSAPVVEKRKTDNAQPNFTCRLCPERLSGIRNFVKKGRKPILVVHYTGEIQKGKQAAVKKSSSYVLRSREADELFGRMINKALGLEMDDFFFQEFPGCIFAHNESGEEDWKRRTEHCKSHLEKTISDNYISALIFTGNAAPLFFGSKARESGGISDLVIANKSLPYIIIRSPEAILAYEKKRQHLERIKDVQALETTKKEEIELKTTILENLQNFGKKIGI